MSDAPAVSCDWSSTLTTLGGVCRSGMNHFIGWDDRMGQVRWQWLDPEEVGPQGSR